MKLEGEQILLRVHLRNTDKCGWRSAAESLVEQARTGGLAGATLIRGIFGSDQAGHILDSAAFSLIEHEPVVVEVVDSSVRIGEFLKVVDRTIPEGMATLERAHVLVYRHNDQTAQRVRRGFKVPPTISALSTLPSEEEFPIMKLAENGQLLRVFIGESDYWQEVPLYRAIVMKAREMGLAGATVLRGSMGFGADSRVHASKFLELSTDLPIVVEIVDAAEQIERLLPFLDETVEEGLITIEAVKVLKYRAHRSPSA